MKYIYGICGTHGTGKSTILYGVRDNGIAIVDKHLARTAQKELGWDSLSRVEESIDNMWALQDAVLASLYDRDNAIIESEVPTLVERTPADVWAYTLTWCERLGIDPSTDKRVRLYRQQCRELANNYAKFICVEPVDAVPFVVDPKRADLKSREFVRCVISSFIWDGALPLYAVKTTGKDERIAEVTAVIRSGV